MYLYNDIMINKEEEAGKGWEPKYDQMYNMLWRSRAKLDFVEFCFDFHWIAGSAQKMFIVFSSLEGCGRWGGQDKR